MDVLRKPVYLSDSSAGITWGSNSIGVSERKEEKRSYDKVEHDKHSSINAENVNIRRQWWNIKRRNGMDIISSVYSMGVNYAATCSSSTGGGWAEDGRYVKGERQAGVARRAGGMQTHSIVATISRKKKSGSGAAIMYSRQWRDELSAGGCGESCGEICGRGESSVAAWRSACDSLQPLGSFKQRT